MRKAVLAVGLIVGLIFGVTAQAHSLIVGLSPSWEETTRAQVNSAVRQIYRSIKPGDHVEFFDAVSLMRIASVELPNDPQLENEDLRLDQLNPQFKPVWSFIKSNHPNRMPAEHLDIPAFMIEAGSNVVQSGVGRNTAIMLIGSALYVDGRESSLDEADGRLPGDGTILSTHEESPYGAKGLAGLLNSATVTFCYTDKSDAFMSEAYRSAVLRYWALFSVALGGRWGASEPLSPQCLSRGIAGTPATIMPTPDPTDTTRSMRHIERNGPPAVALAELTTQIQSALPPPVPAPSPAPSPAPVTQASTTMLPPATEITTAIPSAITEDTGRSKPPGVPSPRPLPGEVLAHALFAEPVCQRPPPSLAAALKIGLKWSDPVDLDLHTKAGPDTWLSWEHPYPARGTNGAFMLDWRLPPVGEDAYEATTYSQRTDLTSLQIHVDEFNGNVVGGVPFTVRVELPGMNCAYEVQSRIAADKGDYGNGNHSGPAWTVIDVPALLKLPPPTARHAAPRHVALRPLRSAEDSDCTC